MMIEGTARFVPTAPMAQPRDQSIDDLLAAAGRGDDAAHVRLWALIYDELHAVAVHQLAKEGNAQRRQPTSLVHEAYLRLTKGEHVEFANRRYFFGAAARAMRQIRVDDARKRSRLKRGGGEIVGRIDSELGVPDQDPAEVLAIAEALEKLEAEDARKAEVVMLRYFGGLSVDECSNALGVSPRTVQSDWRFARAWLHRELAKDDTATDSGECP